MKALLDRPIRLISMLILLSLALATGCEDDGDSKDFGDNNPDLVACIGDSLTQGYKCAGAPYPSRIAEKTGKTVLNFGVAGATSAYGASIISSVVARKPGYVCILFGSNDAIMHRGAEAAAENIRAIIGVCKANRCIPIVGTPPKMIDSHAPYDPAAAATADAIIAVAKEEGVAVVNFYKAFGDGVEFLNPDDGLHLSDAGGDKIASGFASKL
ncbi:MAG: GDSL-type esterase/lipase family protein [Kiritimatiellia bacterium]|jgi:lysophospholipase L1-like esterase